MLKRNIKVYNNNNLKKTIKWKKLINIQTSKKVLTTNYDNLKQNLQILPSSTKKKAVLL